MEILLADNDQTSYLLAATSIKRFGYDVVKRKSSTEVLNWLVLKDESCIVILSDELEDCSIEGLCSQIKNLAHFHYVVVIAKHDDVDHMISILQSGAHDFLASPPIPTLLKSKIKIAERLVNLEKNRQNALDQAEQANRMKSCFLASMSHELRTPLNAIIGYSELMQEQAVAEARKGDVKDHRRVLSSAKHLLTLIDDVLDLSKIEADKMHFTIQRHSLQALMDDVLSSASVLAEKNHNQITLNMNTDQDDIDTDKLRFLQILLNLVSNACKFTYDGNISIKVDLVKNNEATVFDVAVSDEGIGIPVDKQKNLFQMYSQADQCVSEKYGGTGLGLAISQRLANFMGGGIRVESTVDIGSTFILQHPQKSSLS